MNTPYNEIVNVPSIGAKENPIHHIRFSIHAGG